VNLDKRAPVRVDTDYYESPFHTLNPVWSPDSKWLAYTKQLPSHLHAVFVYGVSTQKSTQITDGFSDALYAAWDRSGKYLYLTASTDVGLSASWLDLSSVGRTVTRSAYIAVLSKDDPSPLAPESDEEKDATQTTDARDIEALEMPSRGRSQVIAHPGWPTPPAGSATASVVRRSPSVERPLALAVLTTERKAA